MKCDVCDRSFPEVNWRPENATVCNHDGTYSAIVPLSQREALLDQGRAEGRREAGKEHAIQIAKLAARIDQDAVHSESERLSMPSASHVDDGAFHEEGDPPLAMQERTWQVTT